MAAIAAADVTYTIRTGQDELTGSSKIRRVVEIGFGDATDTYPTGGVPLTKAKMGLPNVIESLTFVEASAGDGLIYKYDDSAATIRIYNADYDATADGALVEYTTASVPAATSLIVDVIGW